MNPDEVLIHIKEQREMTQAQRKAVLHREVCNQLMETYNRKNQDYGDSFAKLREIFPNAVLVRLYDKLQRLISLYNANEIKVKDESIEDTLLDLANYAIMEVVERRIKG